MKDIRLTIEMEKERVIYFGQQTTGKLIPISMNDYGLFHGHPEQCKTLFPINIKIWSHSLNISCHDHEIGYEIEGEPESDWKEESMDWLDDWHEENEFDLSDYSFYDLSKSKYEYKDGKWVMDELKGESWD